jgi:hypothetical protein
MFLKKLTNQRLERTCLPRQDGEVSCAVVVAICNGEVVCADDAEQGAPDAFEIVLSSFFETDLGEVVCAETAET